MFVSHFYAGLNFVVVLDMFLLLSTKKVIACRIRQVVALYSNDCMGICLGGPSTGRLRRVVVLQTWSFGQVWLFCSILLNPNWDSY